MSTHPFADLSAAVRENEPMARHTSFGVGGPVRFFAEPRDSEAFLLAHQRGVAAGLPIRILGRGSNILVTDEPHPWLVISTRHLSGLRHSGSCIEADAGVYLPRLVAAAENWGMGGLEPLAGIPGSVGGAVAMNAGGRYGRVANTLVGAMVARFDSSASDLNQQSEIRNQKSEMVPYWVDTAELGLDYRYSIVPKAGLVLLSATFQLDKAAPRQLAERRLGILAEKHATQPMDALSAGCVFKNPPTGKSAGWLIDQAGLKGARVGGAVVSHKHANFIVNGRNATARDILQLIDIVVKRVLDRFGIELELEIEVWTNNEERR
ncbi:MAG: UDP-N-acetylmuramate dehydrogenase [Planctomycetes bacterium]|nr:UDP-N-acetylmuramate dehydrogenase [Planctomycetota bacterium]